MRLDLVVGPNGAGKSTFVRLTLAPVLPGAAFVNADVIAEQRWPDDPEAHSYEAARIAAATRAALIARRRAVHRRDRVLASLEARPAAQAAAAGYYTALHVVLVPEELAVARVAARVAAGGHAVPGGEDPRALPQALAARGRRDRARPTPPRSTTTRSAPGPERRGGLQPRLRRREPAMAGLGSRCAHRPLASRRVTRRRSRARPSGRRPGGRPAGAAAAAIPCRSSSRQTWTAVMPSRRGPRTSGSHESPTKTTSAGSTPRAPQDGAVDVGMRLARARPGPRSPRRRPDSSSPTWSRNPLSSQPQFEQTPMASPACAQRRQRRRRLGIGHHRHPGPTPAGHR